MLQVEGVMKMSQMEMRTLLSCFNDEEIEESSRSKRGDEGKEKDKDGQGGIRDDVESRSHRKMS